MLARFIEQEHPQTIALVLAHLEPQQGCGVLLKLPEQSRADALQSPGAVEAVLARRWRRRSRWCCNNRLQTVGEQSRRSPMPV